MNMMENVNPAPNPARGSTVPCLSEVLLMFQAAFWGVKENKIDDQDALTLANSSVFGVKKSYYISAERERVFPIRKPLNCSLAK